MFSKTDIYQKAIEIARGAGRGGNTHPSSVFELTFKKLLEIAKQEGLLEE